MLTTTSPTPAALFPQHTPLFSRMIEGVSTAAVPVALPHLNHSKNREFYRQITQRGYGLKYVWSGREQYKVNGQRHSVTDGQFLLVSNGNECEIEIKSRQPVEGFCFYLPEQLVTQTWSGLQQPPEQLLEPTAPATERPDFSAQVFNVRHSALGRLMSRIARGISEAGQPDEELNVEVFHELTGALCGEQLEIKRQQSGLSASKKSTREELHHRILLARDFLHDHFHEPITLTEMAQAAMLSEFHFLRTFKTVFGESPYQYLLRVRLEKAQAMLQVRQSNLSEIAFNCGFREVQTFSKLFRKMKGISPSAYQLTYRK